MTRAPATLNFRGQAFDSRLSPETGKARPAQPADSRIADRGQRDKQPPLRCSAPERPTPQTRRRSARRSMGRAYFSPSCLLFLPRLKRLKHREMLRVCAAALKARGKSMSMKQRKYSRRSLRNAPGFLILDGRVSLISGFEFRFWIFPPNWHSAASSRRFHPNCLDIPCQTPSMFLSQEYPLASLRSTLFWIYFFPCSLNN